MRSEMNYKMNDVGKVLGGMMNVSSCRAMRMNVKRRLYEGVALPTALYGAVSGVGRKKEGVKYETAVVNLWTLLWI